MRILFHKLSDVRHALEVIRGDGRAERVECETRSYLQHDLLHYATEGEASLATGFWGTLAAGTTLAQLDDRAAPMTAGGAEMMMVERLVGALSGAVKGRSADDVVAGLERYASALGQARPTWLTASFVAAVQERMRRLVGQWKATPFGGAMELMWPPREGPPSE